MLEASSTDRLPPPAAFIERRIYVIRGHKVMLDSDLAEIYEVPTKRLNEAVKRNLARFPEDFMFQLSNEEMENWRSQIATSNPAAKMGIRRPPYAFTEHGVVMLSAVLNSDRAVHMSILIVRAFVKLRELLATNKDLARKIEQIESAQKQQANTQEQQTRALQRHGSILVSVVRDIEKLKNPPVTRAIGFVSRSAKKK
jgi:phage regulator Rha-like protein